MGLVAVSAMLAVSYDGLAIVALNAITAILTFTVAAHQAWRHHRGDDDND